MNTKTKALHISIHNFSFEPKNYLENTCLLKRFILIVRRSESDLKTNAKQRRI